MRRARLCMLFELAAVRYIYYMPSTARSGDLLVLCFDSRFLSWLGVTVIFHESARYRHIENKRTGAVRCFRKSHVCFELRYGAKPLGKARAKRLSRSEVGLSQFPAARVYEEPIADLRRLPK